MNRPQQHAFELKEAQPPSFGITKPREDHLGGHRERLRARFMAGGADALPDYELLELVLFRAHPRQDMKPLARRLLARFQNLHAVLAAPSDALEAIEGVGSAVLRELKLFEAVGHRMAQSELAAREMISSGDALLRYCHATLGHARVEELRALFLDRKNALISDERLATGSVAHVPVYPREVAALALRHAASAVILIHNHPSGDPTPSLGDKEMTLKVQAALKTLEIELHDHLVIGGGRHVSFREIGELT